MVDCDFVGPVVLGVVLSAAGCICSGSASMDDSGLFCVALTVDFEVADGDFFDGGGASIGAVACEEAVVLEDLAASDDALISDTDAVFEDEISALVRTAGDVLMGSVDASTSRISGLPNSSGRRLIAGFSLGPVPVFSGSDFGACRTST